MKVQKNRLRIWKLIGMCFNYSVIDIENLLFSSKLTLLCLCSIIKNKTCFIKISEFFSLGWMNCESTKYAWKEKKSIRENRISHEYDMHDLYVRIWKIFTCFTMNDAITLLDHVSWIWNGHDSSIEKPDTHSSQLQWQMYF